MSEWNSDFTGVPRDGDDQVLCIMDYGDWWSYDVASYGWTDNDGDIIMQPEGMPGKKYDYWMRLPSPPLKEESKATLIVEEFD